jgi:hypothetical protein
VTAQLGFPWDEPPELPSRGLELAMGATPDPRQTAARRLLAMLHAGTMSRVVASSATKRKQLQRRLKRAAQDLRATPRTRGAR